MSDAAVRSTREWQKTLLPELPPEARRWTVPPGSEDPDTARALGLPMVGDPC